MKEWNLKIKKEILGFLNQEIGEHEVYRKSQEYVRYETMYALNKVIV